MALEWRQGALMSTAETQTLHRLLHVFLRASSVYFPLPFCLLRLHAMHIYFCGSIRGGRQDVKIYQKIVKKLQTYGQVLTEHVSHDDISENGEDAVPGGDEAIYDRDMEWLAQSDVVVAEVTQPSFGVGYEIGQAMAMKKKILCLFRPSSGRVLSAMIRGAEAKFGSSVFQVRDYVEEEVEDILENYFGELTKN